MSIGTALIDKIFDLGPSPNENIVKWDGSK